MVGDRIHRLRRNDRIAKTKTDQRVAGNHSGEIHRVIVTEHQHYILSVLRTFFEIACDLRPGARFHQNKPLRPTKRRDAYDKEIRCATERLGHERETPTKAEPIGDATRSASREKIARYLHCAQIIADCSAKNGCFRRRDAREHITPAGQDRHGCCRSSEPTNIDAHDVKSLFRPFPLDVATGAITVAVNDRRPRLLFLPGDAIAADLDTAK